MSRERAAVACLVTIVFALAGCGEVVLGPDPAGVEPDDPRFIKPVWERCKPHLSVPTSASTESGVLLPLLILSDDDEPVRLEFGDGSAADALFDADILVWESGVACGEAGVWWEGTADSRSSASRGDVWFFIGGDVDATLDGGLLTGFEVHGELCSGPAGECVPADLLAHELSHVAPADTELLSMELVLLSGGTSATFHAHGHIDYLKKVP